MEVAAEATSFGLQIASAGSYPTQPMSRTHLHPAHG